MTDHEKEILDKIKQSTEKTPVPESLAPDQIMKMLEEHNSTQASGHIPKKPLLPQKAVLQSVHPPVSLPLPIL